MQSPEVHESVQVTFIFPDGAEFVEYTTTGKATRLLLELRALPVSELREAAMASQDEGKGKRVKLFGHSAMSVLRAMGKMGLTAAQAAAVLKGYGIEMSMQTIIGQVSGGKHGRRGVPAKLTGEQQKEIMSQLGK